MPISFRRILAAVALERDPDPVLETAASFAREGEGTLVLAHVIPNDELHLHRPVYRPEESGGANPESAEKAARARLEQIGERLGPRLRLELLTRHGPPADEILRLVEENEPDLLVIGKRRDTSRLHDWLLGGTAYEAVRKASCDLFVVKV